MLTLWTTCSNCNRLGKDIKNIWTNHSFFFADFLLFEAIYFFDVIRVCGVLKFAKFSTLLPQCIIQIILIFIDFVLASLMLFVFFMFQGQQISTLSDSLVSKLASSSPKSLDIILNQDNDKINLSYT